MKAGRQGRIGRPPRRASPGSFTPLRTGITIGGAAILAAVWLGLVDPATVPQLGRASPALSGAARVDDGDSLTINGQRVRLGGGVDAPEWQQTCRRDGRPWRCGEAAKEALRALVSGREVRCDELGRDRYERSLGDCWAGSVNLNREMVRLGWALDYERYSGGRYASEQAEAKAAGRGIWSGEFIPPWEWRAERR